MALAQALHNEIPMSAAIIASRILSIEEPLAFIHYF